MHNKTNKGSQQRGSGSGSLDRNTGNFPSRHSENIKQGTNLQCLYVSSNTIIRGLDFCFAHSLQGSPPPLLSPRTPYNLPSLFHPTILLPPIPCSMPSLLFPSAIDGP